MWTFLAAEEPASLIVPDSVQKANLAEAVNKIVNMDFSTLFGSLIRESLWILVKVLIALAIYFIGRWLVRRFLRLIDVAMQHRNVDISLRSFTRNTVSAFFTLLLILIVLSIHSLLMPGGEAGLKFLFAPDFSKVTPSTVLVALGLSLIHI